MTTSVRLLERIIPPLSRPVGGWHVSAVVDLLAYHTSWLWILVPLALAGDVHPTDYIGLWAVGMTVSFLHRHYTMPYVYLDRDVFARHVTRFTLFPAILAAGFVGSAFLFGWRSPPRFFIPADVALVVVALLLVAQVARGDRAGHRFTVRTLLAVAAPYALALGAGLLGLFITRHALVDAALLLCALLASGAVLSELRSRTDGAARDGGAVVVIILFVAACAGVASLALGLAPLNDNAVRGSALVGAVGAVAAAWNVWHTLMQKFGILRVYAAKSALPVERRVPAWVDRVLLFGSLPFLVAWLGPAQRDVLLTQYKSVTQYLIPVADALSVAQPVLLPVAVAAWAASVACFVWHEWKADGLRTWPRLSMALALTALAMSFLVVTPLKAYAAYGFSHAVEYMVFVLAFLRRRYAEPATEPSVLARLLRRPWLFWGLFSLVVGGGFFITQYGKHYGLGSGGLKLFDVKLSTWFFTFAIWGSMAHFYFDGFLWKVRATHVRASL